MDFVCFICTYAKLKCFQLQGASPPDPLTRGSAPGPRWGLRPQTPLWARAPALAIKRPLFDPPLFVTFRGPCYGHVPALPVGHVSPRSSLLSGRNVRLPRRMLPLVSEGI